MSQAAMASNKIEKRKGRAFPKGRQVDPGALLEVRALLAEQPRNRDLLIEFLHLIQDSQGCLPAKHLTALAHEMDLAMAEVYEVATFYAHFDVVKEDDAPIPPITVRVCDSLSCELAGSADLLTRLAEASGSGVRVVRAPCMGACDKAPVAAVGHSLVEGASPEKVQKAIDHPDHHSELNAVQFDTYCADGGYVLLKECLSGDKTVDDLMETLGGAGLRGLGGAGFPTARKWSLVRAEPGIKAMAVNADEGEPGTFKDRFYLQSDPHRMLEGMLIAAWAVDAKDVYIYLRDEYPEIRQLLIGEIGKVEAAGLSDHVRIHLRRGAGAYICGEESAMIESIEGKRGLPRHRPPYVAQNGIFGRPTLVNNVETLFWIRDILQKGPDWFTGQGKPDHPGFRSYSVSGRVNKPGVVVAPAGITVRELIDDFCGGMADGHSFKGYLPGGASGGILPASMDNLPLDFGTLEKYGCLIGSHAVVILSDKDSIKSAALNLMRFFADESCGQCTPCRAGTEKSVILMESPDWDTDLLGELSETMRDASICGLGQAASNPMLTAIKYFPEEFAPTGGAT